MLRSINNYRMLIYSVVLIVMMIFTSNAKIRGFFAASFAKLKGIFIKDKKSAVKEGE